MPQLILSLLIANCLNSLKVFPQVFKMTSFCYKSAKMMLRSSLSIIGTIWGLTLAMYRSSRMKLFCIKAVLNGFAKFTGKCLFRSLFFIKNADSGLQLYYKRDWKASVFVQILRNFLRTVFLQNTDGGCFCTYILK